MERKNAVYTIAEERSAEEARREHVLLVARNLAAGAAAALFLASFALADIHKLLRAIAPFQNLMAGRIITFYTLLKDTPGALSNILSIFANSGANILTINQTIPTNGCAGVTVTAETSEMHESLEEMMTEITAAEGVLKFEILAA